MSHYEQRLESDLNHIRERVAKVAEQVQTAVKNSVHSLLTSNRNLAATVILGDAVINREIRAIDHLCHAFIVRHLPTSKHLRVMSAVIRAIIQMERIGDYAATISRETIQLKSAPDDTIAREISLMADQSQNMLAQAVASFNQCNAESAKATMLIADQVEHSFDTVFHHLVDNTKEHTDVAGAMFSLFVVFSMLERVSDQAKNICEEAVFCATGQTKAAKNYRILFLSEGNDLSSQMAVAIAQRSFPNSGTYNSAGRSASTELNPVMVKFMQERGFDLSAEKPATLDAVHSELAEYHIIISLRGAVEDYINEIPFHTTPLAWDITEVSSTTDEQQTERAMEEMYRQISTQLRDLVETLHGPEAA